MVMLTEAKAHAVECIWEKLMRDMENFCAGSKSSEIESKPAAIALLTLHYQAQWKHNPQPRHHEIKGAKDDYHFLHRGRTILEIDIEKKISATYRSFKFLLNSGLLVPESYWGSKSDKHVAITHEGIRCHLCARYRLFGIRPDYDNDLEFFTNSIEVADTSNETLDIESRVAF